jgi:hypothetical protein
MTFTLECLERKGVSTFWSFLPSHGSFECFAWATGHLIKMLLRRKAFIQLIN